MSQYSLTPPPSQQTLNKDDGQVDWQLTMVKRGRLVDATIQLAFKVASGGKIELPLLPEGYRPIHDMVVVPLVGGAGTALFYMHSNGGNEIYTNGTVGNNFYTHATWMTER